MDSHLLCFFLRNTTVTVRHNRYLFQLGCPLPLLFHCKYHKYSNLFGKRQEFTLHFNLFLHLRLENQAGQVAEHQGRADAYGAGLEAAFENT